MLERLPMLQDLSIVVSPLWAAVTKLRGIFPRAVTQLRRLQHLKLRITEAVFDAENSVELVESLGSMAQLKTLRISDACGGSLPSSLTQLTGLRTLSLHHELQTLRLPMHVSRLVSLKILQLDFPTFRPLMASGLHALPAGLTEVW